ncbi:uncharacterized protein LOC134188528 [Corticium candelabrum]|uniref:uncharacterized protein LOC134188528 n=1 Tax=Corticium candelabrum TaxID=121492 RepID=UPI002E25AB36|nr:uncharacterized protein LOC134188528 [Corticium candelabrum]
MQITSPDRRFPIGFNTSDSQKLSIVATLVTSSTAFRHFSANNSPFPIRSSPGFTSGPKFNFPRSTYPDINRYASHKALIGRKLLQENLQFLHKTVGSRHMEMLKVNLSDGIDPQTYSTSNLRREMRWLQMRLGESFPKLCNFMLNLTKEVACAKPRYISSLANQKNPLSASEWIDLKTFAAMLVYGEQMIRQGKLMET